MGMKTTENGGSKKTKDREQKGMNIIKPNSTKRTEKCRRKRNKNRNQENAMYETK